MRVFSRAEASADDKYAALDAAFDKLTERLRRAADRRRVSRGKRPETGDVPGAAAPVAVADRQQAEPVLVPLPPGAWAAMSGLMGLAAVAAWRKHRLREE